jgi:hypothetical protein
VRSQLFIRNPSAAAFLQDSPGSVDDRTTRLRCWTRCWARGLEIPAERAEGREEVAIMGTGEDKREFSKERVL